jgi:hypothetical protein
MAVRKPTTSRLASLLLVLLALALFAVVLMTAAPDVHAQKGGARTPTMSDSEKGRIVDQRLYEKDTDEAYKKTLRRIPDAPKADPWGSVREEPKKK